MQNSDEALCCQLMHIASDSLEIAKSSLKLLDLARFSLIDKWKVRNISDFKGFQSKKKSNGALYSQSVLV